MELVKEYLQIIFDEEINKFLKDSKLTQSEQNIIQLENLDVMANNTFDSNLISISLEDFHEIHLQYKGLKTFLNGLLG